MQAADYDKNSYVLSLSFSAMPVFQLNPTWAASGFGVFQRGFPSGH